MIKGGEDQHGLETTNLKNLGFMITFQEFHYAEHLRLTKKLSRTGYVYV